jgi:hypothetical protein
MKNYYYVNAPRDKTVKAAGLKILDCIGKCISELLKKSRLNRQSGSQVISIRKRAFFRDGALIPSRPVYVTFCNAGRELLSKFKATEQNQNLQ